MPDIVVEQQGLAGYITLNRPEALNSLTHDMIIDIHAGIRQHEADDRVDIIVLRSSSDRAFCAGGDMKATRLQAIDKQWDELQYFFREEYALNLHIAQCAKPYVSMVNGIAMGGGLGLSVHGDVLVVNSSTRMAMPETAIGFFPDVGGTYFLSRLPYDAGLWLALSGMPVVGRQAVAVGLATHFIEAKHWPALFKAFEQDGRQALDDALLTVADNKPESDFIDTLKQRRAWFASKHQDALMESLKGASVDHEDARKLFERIDAMSPYAIDLTRRLLFTAKQHDLAACLKLELIAADLAVRHPDFVEGIRAVLVDKNKASWVKSG